MRKMLKFNLINSLKISLSIILLFAIYLSFIGGYGSDEDTLPMIGVFEAILNSGGIMTSRFTGYPVAEFGIGFLSHFFGSFIANLFTFSLLLVGLFFLYLTFFGKISKKIFLIFFVLSLSNPVIFFENLEPIDYSWSLAPFSIGCFFYKKKKYELAMLFFAVSIGARLNFGLFIIFFILFFINKNLNLKRKISFIISTLIFGSLFYLPTWYTHQFGFEWLTAARPTDQGFFGLFARFLYKNIHLLTPLSFIFIIFVLIKLNKFGKIFQKKNEIYLYIILSNLLLFLWIPAELSYLLLGLIMFYILLIKNFEEKIIISIIILNLSSWVIQPDFLRIIYKNKINKCSPSQAIGAKFEIYLKRGAIQNYLETRDMIKCWVDVDTDRGNKILNGEALR